MAPPDSNDDFTNEIASYHDEDIDESLSEAEMELLRVALVEHGKRLAALEDRMEIQMEDLRSVIGVIRRTYARMRTIGVKLGIKED